MEENKIVIYQTEDGQTQIDVRLENEMFWLTRQQLADLFGRDYKTISKHINNALKEELADSVVVAKFANTTQQKHMGTVSLWRPCDEVKRGYVRSEEFDAAIKPILK